MNFIDKVRAWWALDADKRDYAQGAMYMLQITTNRIQYNNVMRNLERHHDSVDWIISKYIKEQLSEETKAQVKEMRHQVEVIDAKVKLSSPKKDVSARARGKRIDHDLLPDEIKALWTENLHLLQSMREDHLQLRVIARDPKVTCLDSEQYPFLKDIIEKDQRLRDNWKQYDSYSADTYLREKEEKENKATNLKITRVLNLYKGRLKKNPEDASLKAKCLEYYKQMVNPSEALTDEMKNLGVL